jgi:four helix bundle protein
MSAIKHFRELKVYQNAMTTTMRVFELTKTFLAEEKFSLTDQFRRSSRSICANVAEAWRKRRYRAAFISKLSDAETEAAETQVWAELAWRCGYLPETHFLEVDDACNQIIGQLVKMVDQPEKWLIAVRKS